MLSNDSGNTAPIIRIEDLDFAYNGQAVLEKVNLEVYEGDFIAMIGPNGGGKTTLLKLMLGLLKPIQGNVRVLGQTPRQVSHQIGYVPQDVNINRRFPITALDVVLMGKLAPGRRWSKNRQQDRIDAWRPWIASTWPNTPSAASASCPAASASGSSSPG
uniref:ATP-binding cassette domain-containing protein n=1 Tax=Desulfosarcina cetonica TaxID=90730 RepID=UPI00155DC9AC